MFEGYIRTVALCSPHRPWKGVPDVRDAQLIVALLAHHRSGAVRSARFPSFREQAFGVHLASQTLIRWCFIKKSLDNTFSPTGTLLRLTKETFWRGTGRGVAKKKKK